MTKDNADEGRKRKPFIQVYIIYVWCDVFEEGEDKINRAKMTCLSFWFYIVELSGEEFEGANDGFVDLLLGVLFIIPLPLS